MLNSIMLSIHYYIEKLIDLLNYLFFNEPFFQIYCLTMIMTTLYIAIEKVIAIITGSEQPKDQSQYDTYMDDTTQDAITQNDITQDAAVLILQKDYTCKQENKEIIKAIEVGQHALNKLREAKHELTLASIFGVNDILGGGISVNILKRMKMSDAKELLKSANNDLKSFQKELQDMDVPEEVKYEVIDFLAFADIFMDGCAVDLLVQAQILNIQNRVSEAIEKVEQILKVLKAA